jgi:hypothetical protein
MTTSREVMAASQAHRRWARSGREPAMTDNENREHALGVRLRSLRSTPNERRNEMEKRVKIKVNGLVHSSSGAAR